MSDEEAPTVAVFRPADDRLNHAVTLLESHGATPLPDPMLEVSPAGTVPRDDADVTVFTSKTGVELASDAGWSPTGTLCAIGRATADAMAGQGYEADVVPSEFSSVGLVEALGDDVAGARIEVARSDHGSDVLLDGLNDAGAYIHETVLYELTRPAGSGESTERAAAGEVDAALFTSSLTVEHFLAAAAERGVHNEAVDGLAGAVVGCIGDPTRETAEREGIPVDVVPDEADFEALARAVVEQFG